MCKPWACIYIYIGLNWDKCGSYGILTLERKCPLFYPSSIRSYKDQLYFNFSFISTLRLWRPLWVQQSFVIESEDYIYNIHIRVDVGTWWHIGWVESFQPESRGFDSRSGRHEVTLGKSLTHSCLRRFGVKLRHSICAVSCSVQQVGRCLPRFAYCLHVCRIICMWLYALMYLHVRACFNVCVYSYVCMRACTSLCVCRCACMPVFVVCMCVCACLYMSLCESACMCRCEYASLCLVCVCICLNVALCVHVSLYVCICMSTLWGVRGSLVESTPFVRRVIGSTPALAT